MNTDIIVIAVALQLALFVFSLSLSFTHCPSSPEKGTWQRKYKKWWSWGHKTAFGSWSEVWVQAVYKEVHLKAKLKVAPSGLNLLSTKNKWVFM